MKLDPLSSQPSSLPFLSSSCFLNISMKEHLNHFAETNFHLPMHEEYTFRDSKEVQFWEIVAVYPNSVMNWWNLAFPGLTCSPWDVIPLLKKCALRVPCSVEGESGRLSVKNRSHIFLSPPCLLRLLRDMPSCSRKEFVSKHWQTSGSLYLYVAHRCRSWEIWDFIKYGFHF